MPNLKISAMPGLGTNAAPGDLLTVVDVSAPAATANKRESLNNLLSVITRGITDKALRFQTGTAPAVSLAAQGSIYFDGIDFQISANGGAYAPLLSLSPQADHAVLIGPTSGGPSAPTWRGLALSDLPAIATNRLLGRVSPLSGDVEEITPGAGVLAWLQNPTSANLLSAVATTSTGSGALVFGSNAALDAPAITGGIRNIPFGQRILTFSDAGGTTINNLEIVNATVSNPPILRAVSATTANIALQVQAKGSGNVRLLGDEIQAINNNATLPGALAARGGSQVFGGGQLRLYERTTNGTNWVGFEAPDSLASDLFWTLPATDGTAGQGLVTNGGGGLSWSNVQTFKNFLINGNMQIAQRGTSATALGPTNASSGYHTADRWRIEIDQFGANGQYTQSIEIGVADYPADTVFRKSLKMTCTQAVSSPLAAAAQLRLDQRIESQNLTQVEIGNATAKQLTVSFWVKSNKTGLFVAELIDPNGSQQVSGTFQIVAANTWEKHVVTFPANPTGTIIANNNSYGLAVSFWLVAGSNFTSGTLQTAWGNTTANRAAGFAVNSQITALNDYLQITGCQLEIGAADSEFELLPVATNLFQCQRYFVSWVQHVGGVVSSISQGNAQGANQLEAVIRFPVSMRDNPTFFATTGTNLYSFFNGNGNLFFNTLQGAQLTTSGALLFTTGIVIADITAAGRFFIPSGIASGPTIRFSAEL